jgi:carbonic anhydrase
MRLFEAIVDANHRAVAGDASAGLRPADFENELPVIALTCVDPRLNALFPNVLGLPGEQFIWLRNAGNIITGPLSSTMRSLALACAVKGGKEIAIIGHTDCQVGHTTTMQLIEKLETLGVKRHLLPENINEFFGMFGSERQNVIKSCDFVRKSPLIGPKIPVHGFLVDIATGKLEWLVNGYQNWDVGERWSEVAKAAGHPADMMKSLGDFHIGEMKFPETKIGETVVKAGGWLSGKIGELETKAQGEIQKVAPIIESAEATAKRVAELAAKNWPKEPPRIPPPIRPRMHVRREGK